jgi:hypothetical protein
VCERGYRIVEDFDERLEALMQAWSLARTLLVVSVMLANQNDPRGQRFCDGVMTKRGAFQKYFSQGEIKAFVEQVLGEEPIAVAQANIETMLAQSPSLKAGIGVWGDAMFLEMLKISRGD